MIFSTRFSVHVHSGAECSNVGSGDLLSNWIQTRYDRVRRGIRVCEPIPGRMLVNVYSTLNKMSCLSYCGFCVQLRAIQSGWTSTEQMPTQRVLGCLITVALWTTWTGILLIDNRAMRTELIAWSCDTWTMVSTMVYAHWSSAPCVKAKVRIFCFFFSYYYVAITMSYSAYNQY